MVCESARQSWTVLNWAVQDQSPDSWSCRGFSPRWKSLTRLWCCFDWRKRSVVHLFECVLSVFKVLHIWPFTAWAPRAAMERKWLFKWSRLLCLLACPARCFLQWVVQTANQGRLPIISRCGFKCVDSTDVSLGGWGLIKTSLLMNPLIHLIVGSVLSHQKCDKCSNAGWLFCNRPLPGRHRFYWKSE